MNKPHPQSVIDSTAVVTKSLFASGGYSIDLTDKGGVRIGQVGGAFFDIPRGHAWYDRVHESGSLFEVQSHYDELLSAFA